MLLLPIVPSPVEFINISSDVVKHSIGIDSNFVDYCKKNNISVYAAAPNIYHSNFTSKKEKKFFNEILLFYKQNDIPFLGAIEDGFYTDFSDIYDTDYHLTTKSSIRRSEFFVKNLKNLIHVN